MAIRKEPNAEPIPGYRLLELLGKGGCGEVWKCEAPGGLYKAIKFVHGNLKNIAGERVAAEDELRSIEHIKSIRHPFLLSMDRVECLDGELVIVTELADRNLHQLLEEHRRAGHHGIPRRQVLEYLREAAEVLDLLNHVHGLQHLDIKPRNLFLVWNHIKVGDFGLVNSLSGDNESAIQLGAVTPLYASPELFQGRISPHCDQYSLAVTFQELLTGTLPFQGKTARELLLQHVTTPPNLDPLPPADRPVLARALAKEPDARFASCADLVRALMDCKAKSEDRPTTDSASRPSFLDPQAAGRPSPTELSAADTVNAMSLTAANVPAAAPSRSPNGKAGPYQLRECLGATPLVETWRAEGPDGQQRLLKYLFGFGGNRKQQEEALQRLRSLHHPVLLPVEVVEATPGRIAVVTDLIDRSLREYLLQCQSRQQHAIPRAELLELLRPVAEGLDYLYRQHSIAHLGLHLRNLRLSQGQLLVDEFGLMQLLWLPGGQVLSQPLKRYSAPELLRGQVHPTADQYSLALIYFEAVTGKWPQVEWKPGNPVIRNLELLPPRDREAITRALDTDARKRWCTCRDLMDALEGECTGPSRISNFAADQFTALVRTASPVNPQVDRDGAAASASALKEILAQLIHSAGGEVNAADEQAPALSEDGQTLRHKFTAGLPLGDARLKLDGVREQVYGQLIQDADQRFAFHVNATANFWQQLTGRLPGLEVAVTLNRQHPLALTPIEVKVEVAAYRCAKKRGRQLLEEVGVSLLERVRSALLVNSEKRVQDRLLWPHNVEVIPVYADGTTGEAVPCRGKDLSMGGIGFYLPHQLDTTEIFVVLHAESAAGIQKVSIPSTLVRARPCADGGYEVGALFRLVALRSSVHDVALSALSS
jgi:serine/threonine protein kinase